ncbi:neuronal acetylcholine receptor subunit alpha-6-like [Argopecten irradians]|uniref:neuronal acetylcholine receptor subunit alpha-6-like n=1 Tax=Argopecten irradians TaxID=31199 RepID=UPI0037130D5A
MIVNFNVVILVYLCIHGVQTSTRLDQQALHEKLLQTYNGDLGPNFNQSEPVIIHLAFDLITLNEFDDITGKLAILGLLLLEWRDDRMVWDPLQYGNTTSVRIPQSKVWIPNLFVGKPHTKVKKIGYDFVQVSYTSDGWARWAVPDLFEVSCTANVLHYPIDGQRCEIFIGPWTIGRAAFKFRLPFDYMTQNEFIENGAWDVLSTQLYVQSHKGVDLVAMVINFERRPLFIFLNIFLPIIIVEVLNVFIFLLPPEPGERSAFGVTVLLAMAVFLSVVSEKLPSTSEPHIARVSIYIAAELVLSALIMVFALISLILYNRKDYKPIPDWIKRLLSKRSNLQKHRQEVARVLSSNADSYPRAAIRYVGKENLQRDGHYENGKELIEIYRGYRVERIWLENTDRYNQDYGAISSYTGSEADSEISVVEADSCVTWTEVAKCFDKLCLALFSILTVCIIAAKAIDATVYKNTY